MFEFNALYDPEPEPEHVPQARAALRRRAHLSDWEVRFLESIIHFQQLSPKQSAMLLAIRGKVIAKTAKKGKRQGRRWRGGR
jgi:hypothetical protein